MTASERARELVRAYAVALLKRWPRQVEREHVALLAYVARLEACVEAARIEVERADKYGCRELRLSLAALDRPEDGETT